MTDRGSPEIAARLRELQRSWDVLGREDPMWAVLSDPAKTGGRWDLHDFLATGEQEVEGAVRLLHELGIDVGRTRALDFGCGIGRLARAFAGEFDLVDAVDISSSMVERGREVVADRPNVRLHVVDGASLPFPDATFDFVYSRLVLQHMRTEIALANIAEFVRVLVPGGVTMFQTPTRLLLDVPPGPSEIRFDDDHAFIEMNAHAPDVIAATVEAHGAAIVADLDDPVAGPEYESRRFVVRRHRETSSGGRSVTPTGISGDDRLDGREPT